MKNLLLAAAIVFGFASCNSSDKKTNNNEEGNDHTGHVHSTADFNVDTENSVVYWKGDMVGMYAHTGTVNVKDGNLSIKEGIITKGSFTVDLTSMLTNDDDALYKMAPREKLLGHLMADDFFGVESYPTASFVVKSHDGTTLIGDLTIKGITNEASISNVSMSEEGGVLKAKGDLVFDRQKFNVSWAHPMKDRILSDDIELNIELAAKSL